MDSSVKYKKFAVTDGDLDTEKPSDHDKIRSGQKCVIIGALLTIALVAVISALAIGIGVGVSVSQSKQTAPSGGLSTITVTDEQLEGYYYSQNSGGIYFLSTSNSTHVVLLITTTDGQQIVYIVHPVVSNMTIMGVNDTNFMIMENQPDRPKYDDYVIDRDAMDMMMSLMDGRVNMSDRVMQHLDNTTVNETRVSVLQRLATSEKAILIIEAARALGDQGVQGTDYSSAMNFYLFAIQLGNLGAGDSTATGAISDTNALQRRKRYGQTTCNNGAECSPGRCPFRKYSNDCFGMCGPNCLCWGFVCGDCCVHQYCLTHDQCCADEGFFSWACLSVAWRVLGSRCTSTYGC